MLTLTIYSQHSLSAAPLSFDRVEAGITTDVQHRFARQILRKAFTDRAPNAGRMIGWFTAHALSFCEESVSEINPVEPRLEPFEFGNDLCAIGGHAETSK